MKIELGKKYINSNGDIVEIILQDGDLWFPFKWRDYSYTSTGSRIIEEENPEDLICEVVPELYYALMQGWITQKQFIEKHIEHWSRVNA